MKIASLLLTALTMSMVLGGCATNDNAIIENELMTGSEETTSSEPIMFKADVTFNGKTCESIKDLHDITEEEFWIYAPENMLGTSGNGNTIGFDSWSKDGFNWSKVYLVRVDSLYDPPVDFSINGIKMGDNIEDVLPKAGNPEVEEVGEHSKIINYEVAEKTTVKCYFVDDVLKELTYVDSTVTW